jgi:catechol 2,3-dioxygenase-like lactoylglutathione lyase family enzyme
MLANQPLKAFIPTVNPQKAKEFYGAILGLPLVGEDSFALQFNANGTFLRVTTVQQLQPQPFTVLGWSVADIDVAVTTLAAKGVVFEQYGLPGQDDKGIWTAPGGTKVAWFKDADGNLLSLDSAA